MAVVSQTCPNGRVAFSLAFALLASLTVSFSASAEPVVRVDSTDASSSAVLSPISKRFRNPKSAEIPDFQRHVMPLLGRLGCNGRSCHGSFQGRGDFQLSLFGYDFKADHEALLADQTGRVDTVDIEESLILAKPSDADMHEGGKRFDAGSWQYTTLRRWIESGAAWNRNEIQPLSKLEVQPAEIQYYSDDQSTQLKVIAHWADGSREDVTELSRFSTNDESIASISENGLVKSGMSGDTHVVVSYDRSVVPVPILRRVVIDQDTPVAQPPVSDHPVDKLIAEKLNKLGITASALCTDAEFIRRVSLDITGTLPAADEVREFLSDASTDKRKRLVDELLTAPGYAAWWATRFSDWTGNSDQQLNNALPVRGSASRLWYQWLRVRLDDNVPYDEIVEGIVTATGRQEGESYEQYCRDMTKACSDTEGKLFAQRDDMHLFWNRRNFQKPEDRAIGFAYAFMGIRIECAQCHKHPFDRWSKDDFDRFKTLFTNVNGRTNAVSRESKAARDQMLQTLTGGKKLRGGDLRKLIYTAARKGTTVPFAEVYFDDTRLVSLTKAAQKRAKKTGKKPNIDVPEAYLLGEEEPIKLNKDPREDLMQWLRDPANPYFASAVVNRVWSNYFGIGIVNPTDDMNLANPPSNQALLDYLSQEFVANDFDLKWLHRTIATSDAYGRSVEPNASNAQDRVNFARHVPRRLPAEVIHDAVLLATESSKDVQRMRSQMNDMAIAADVTQNRNNRNFALQVFGQSERESNCDCDRSDSPSLLQSIYLRNDLDVYRQLDSKDGWVAQACRTLGVDAPGSNQVSVAQTQIDKKVQLVRKQLIGKVERYNQLAPDRREKARPKMSSDYRSLKTKFEKYGYNFPKLADLIAAPRQWKLEKIESAGASHADQGSLSDVVKEAYLRTLSRYPDHEEVAIATDYIESSESTAKGISSLVWALVNTKEFIITH